MYRIIPSTCVNQNRTQALKRCNKCALDIKNENFEPALKKRKYDNLQKVKTQCVSCEINVCRAHFSPICFDCKASKLSEFE